MSLKPGSYHGYGTYFCSLLHTFTFCIFLLNNMFCDSCATNVFFFIASSKCAIFSLWICWHSCFWYLSVTDAAQRWDVGAAQDDAVHRWPVGVGQGDSSGRVAGVLNLGNFYSILFREFGKTPWIRFISYLFGRKSCFWMFLVYLGFAIDICKGHAACC